jgi:hypothetical protein
LLLHQSLHHASLSSSFSASILATADGACSMKILKSQSLCAPIWGYPGNGETTAGQRAYGVEVANQCSE